MVSRLMVSSLQEVLSMNYIIIQKDKEIFKLNIKDIYYIQTHPSKAHTVQIVTENASFDLFQNLSNLENQYGETLTRCHRNCLVNLEKLKSIDFQERILFLGEEGRYAVQYSRRRYREIRQKWLKQGE